MRDHRYCRGGSVPALFVVWSSCPQQMLEGSRRAAPRAMHPAPLCGKVHTEVLMSLVASPAHILWALFPSCDTRVVSCSCSPVTGEVVRGVCMPSVETASVELADGRLRYSEIFEHVECTCVQVLEKSVLTRG